MIDLSRYRSAAKAGALHFFCTVLVAMVAATVVFGVWYVYPYHELSGGRELFWLIIAVDVVCGPLLTFVLFNPKKSRKQLTLDLGLVALIQFAALGYGLSTAWQARPLYLVHEVDRFKVISAPDVDAAALNAVPEYLQPKFWTGPKTVGIRGPKDAEEHNRVLFEAAAGGRDYAERPEFYVPYEGKNALEAIKRAKPIALFLQKQPNQVAVAQKLAVERKADISQWLYLPVVARQDWVAVLDKQGRIQGFLKGDGF